MNIFEMFAGPDEQEQQDMRFSPDQDHTALKMSDTRKTRLTLGHIQKLRLMNELRAIEMKQELVKVKAQYGTPPAEAAPGM